MKGKEEIWFNCSTVRKTFSQASLHLTGTLSLIQLLLCCATVSHPSQASRQLPFPHRNQWRTLLQVKKERRGTGNRCWLRWLKNVSTDSLQIRQDNDNNHKNRHVDIETIRQTCWRQTNSPMIRLKLRGRKAWPLPLPLWEKWTLFLSRHSRHAFIGDCLFQVNHCCRQSKDRRQEGFQWNWKQNTLETPSVNENSNTNTQGNTIVYTDKLEDESKQTSW